MYNDSCSAPTSASVVRQSPLLVFQSPDGATVSLVIARCRHCPRLSENAEADEIELDLDDIPTDTPAGHRLSVAYERRHSAVVQESDEMDDNRGGDGRRRRSSAFRDKRRSTVFQGDKRRSTVFQGDKRRPTLFPGNKRRSTLFPGHRPDVVMGQIIREECDAMHTYHEAEENEIGDYRRSVVQIVYVQISCVHRIQ